MKISVIIPAYNPGAYLDEALRTVAAQTVPPDEIIVVDDGSTDPITESVLNEWAGRIRLFSQENSGIGPARNKGILNASGDWIAFLDADDLWLPEKLRRQKQSAEGAPDVGMVSASMRCFVSPELPDETKSRLQFLETHPQAFLASAVFVRRSLFERVGLFSETLRAGEFIEWCARLRSVNVPTLHLAEVLVHRRVHGSNTGRREAGSRNDYIKALKAVIDRKRQDVGR